MRIAEIYRSVQGEGLLTGVPSVFVRTSGCNLRCWFCDTPYTSWRPEGRDMSIDEVVAQVAEWDTGHGVGTRGRHRPDVIRRLIGEYDYQLKFVIDTRSDLVEVNKYLAEFPEICRDRVLLMAQG